MGTVTPSATLYSGRWKLFLVSTSGRPWAQHTQRAGLCSQQNRPAPPYAMVSPACLPFRSPWSSESHSSLDPSKDGQLTRLSLSPRRLHCCLLASGGGELCYVLEREAD